MSDSKQQGQLAYEVYYSALDGEARNWEMSLDIERSAWAAVEAQGWVSAEEKLAGAIAYLAAEIGQYTHERVAPPRIKRAKELLESLLPAPPTKEGT